MSLRIQRVRHADDTLARWMERLVKLIPAEIVPVYTLVREFGGELWQETIWPLTFLALTFIFRAYTTKEDDKEPQWLAAGIASVAFVFWVYITGGNFFGWEADTQIMTGIMLIFMLIVSKFYPPTE
ncbi:MAG: hypothetical protein PVI99_08710 [Anaerolineales bacterium]